MPTDDVVWCIPSCHNMTVPIPEPPIVQSQHALFQSFDAGDSFRKCVGCVPGENLTVPTPMFKYLYDHLLIALGLIVDSVCSECPLYCYYGNKNALEREH